jgi:outer membrane lipoprotein
MTALTLATAAAIGGCATVPAPLAGDNFSAVTPRQAVAQNAGAQRVRWGGEILKVSPRTDATCFEILSRELNADARPNRRDHSEGRFIACKQGFFDPAVYTKGRDVTVVGALDGNEHHKVGEFDYTFAKVAADEIYMWPRRAEFESGYYDPFWSPGCDPFWGPCFGWGGYWNPRPIVVIKPTPKPGS